MYSNRQTINRNIHWKTHTTNCWYVAADPHRPTRFAVCRNEGVGRKGVYGCWHNYCTTNCRSELPTRGGGLNGGRLWLVCAGFGAFVVTNVPNDLEIHRFWCSNVKKLELIWQSIGTHRVVSIILVVGFGKRASDKWQYSEQECAMGSDTNSSIIMLE